MVNLVNENQQYQDNYDKGVKTIKKNVNSLVSYISRKDIDLQDPGQIDEIAKVYTEISTILINLRDLVKRNQDKPFAERHEADQHYINRLVDYSERAKSL